MVVSIHIHISTHVCVICCVTKLKHQFMYMYIFKLICISFQTFHGDIQYITGQEYVKNLYRSYLILVFSSSLQESHLFVNFDAIVRHEVWKLHGTLKFTMGMSFLLPDFSSNAFTISVEFYPIRLVSYT